MPDEPEPPPMRVVHKGWNTREEAVEATEVVRRLNAARGYAHLDACRRTAVTSAERRPRESEREYLLRSATHDAKQAVECMDRGDWLRADILLKLAVDQIADAGVLP